MNKITIRELYQRVLDGENIIKKIKYRNEIFEFHKGENFYRHFGDYGSYWLPFDLDEKVIILDKKEVKVMIEEGVSHIAYFRTDGGSSKLYTQEYVDNLQNQLQQKENIIKEVRDYIKRKDICIDTRKTDGSMDYVDLEKELLEILDKVSDE